MLFTIVSQLCAFLSGRPSHPNSFASSTASPSCARAPRRELRRGPARLPIDPQRPPRRPRGARGAARLVDKSYKERDMQ